MVSKSRKMHKRSSRKHSSRRVRRHRGGDGQFSAVPTPVAPTPVAPTPVAPTPVAPTPVAQKTLSDHFSNAQNTAQDAAKKAKQAFGSLTGWLKSTASPSNSSTPVAPTVGGKKRRHKSMKKIHQKRKSHTRKLKGLSKWFKFTSVHK